MNLDREIQEAIMDLLISYSTKQDPPGQFEVQAVERTLPYVKDIMEPTMYELFVDWVKRHKDDEIVLGEEV